MSHECGTKQVRREWMKPPRRLRLRAKAALRSVADGLCRPRPGEAVGPAHLRRPGRRRGVAGSTARGGGVGGVGAVGEGGAGRGADLRRLRDAVAAGARPQALHPRGVRAPAGFRTSRYRNRPLRPGSDTRSHADERSGRRGGSACLVPTQAMDPGTSRTDAQQDLRTPGTLRRPSPGRWRPGAASRRGTLP